MEAGSSAVGASPARVAPECVICGTALAGGGPSWNVPA